MTMSLLVVAGVTMSACGPLGDDDTDPTATADTIEQPTTASTEEPAATEPDGAMDATTEPVEDGTPVEDSTPPSTPRPFDLGTPVPETDTETVATTEVVSVSTPVLDLEEDDSIAGTPVTGETDPAATPSDPDGEDAIGTATDEATGDEPSSPSSFGGSDGTSGATPQSGSDDGPTDSEGDEATPFFVPDDPTPTPVPEQASPVADGTPVAPEDATVADLSPLMVTSCEPEEIPEITIDQVSYLTTADVNFRTGPGADCDLIETIGTNQEATVLGGPVTREEDDFVWVQVEIADDIGWIVIDVLEPSE